MDESTACTPIPLNRQGFNKRVALPCGLTTTDLRKAMGAFLDFLGFLNQQSHTRQLPRLESFLMPANFSSMVGAQLEKSDWAFFGRSATSRRTITASVTRSGFEKMEANWLYRSE